MRCEVEVLLLLPRGLHARPATVLAGLVKKSDCHVVLRLSDGQEADASSMISTLCLGLEKNSVFTLIVEGQSADGLLRKLVELFSLDDEAGLEQFTESQISGN